MALAAVGEDSDFGIDSAGGEDSVGGRGSIDVPASIDVRATIDVQASGSDGCTALSALSWGSKQRVWGHQAPCFWSGSHRQAAEPSSVDHGDHRECNTSQR